MKIAIHQPQYMPWVGYFHKMASADIFILLDDVQFKKNEWQHRNRIRTSQGTQWLTVPNRYKFPQTIHEVPINNDTDWATKHLRSLEMNYGKSPHFKYYHTFFKEFFSREWNIMDDITIDSIKLLRSMLGITTQLQISSFHGFPGKSTERLVNICKHYGADTYIAGEGANNYMDLEVFNELGITVEFQNFTCPRYNQHWAKTDEDFIPKLSVLDLIVNVGPDSLDLLMGKK